ncbi:MAG: FecR domain-containing protein [Candidatus Marinimicrobia bacterium]|nr:FecR domain-containing protein [Candidatus Neomarinimicrobiota bacterium]
MNLKRIGLYLLLGTVSLAWGADRIALATKVSGQVSLIDLAKQTGPLKRGTVLEDGMTIKTGPDGLAIVMFIDDKSILRIHKNTVLTVGGERSATAISKNILIEIGKVRAQVSEQRRGEFVIATPTSVASVKGTDFWVTTDPVLGDIFLGIEGLIEVQNLISGEIIEVGGGQVGTSNPDGTIAVTTYVLIVGELLTVGTNLLTLEAAEGFNGQVILNDQTTYAGPEPAVGGSAIISGIVNDDGSVVAIQVEVEELAVGGDAGSANELRIQLEDANGNTKEVIIIYQ